MYTLRKYTLAQTDKIIEDPNKANTAERKLADMLHLHDITFEKHFGGLLIKLSDATAVLRLIWQSHLKPHLLGLELFVHYRKGGYSRTQIYTFPPPYEEAKREELLSGFLDEIASEWWSDHVLIIVGDYSDIVY